MARASRSKKGGAPKKSGGMKRGVKSKKPEEAADVPARKAESSRAARIAGTAVKALSRGASAKRLKELEKKFKGLALSPRSIENWKKRFAEGTATQREKVRQVGGWSAYRKQKELRSSNQLKGIASRESTPQGKAKAVAAALTNVGLSVGVGRPKRSQIPKGRKRRPGRGKRRPGRSK